MLNNNSLRIISHDDPALCWHNVAEWTLQEHGFRPQRVPERWRKSFPELTAWRALQCAGVVLRFRTDSVNLCFEWWQESIVDFSCGEVFVDGKLIGGFHPDTPESARRDCFTAPGGEMATWEIFFPWHFQVHIRAIGIDDGARLEHWDAGNIPHTVLCYGDSITQGWWVTRGSMPWPEQISHKLGVDTINLGFGGAAYCEKEVAEYIASRNDWTAVTISAGINTASTGSETAQEFRNRYAIFIETIRAAHPVKPVLCILPTLCIKGDGTSWRNSSGCKISQYRDAIREVVSRRQVQGDLNIHLLEGLDIINSAEQLIDDVHPHDTGMQQLAQAIANKWQQILKLD